MKTIIAILLFLAGIAKAVDTVNNPTPAQVLNTINSTAAGGTVRIMPANASLSWSSALNFSKNITLDLNGATITRNMSGVNGPVLIAGSVAGGIARVTNGTFAGGLNGSGYNARYIKLSTQPGGGIRLDHCTLQPSGVVSLEMNHTGGQMLVDHCTFSSSDPDEIIHQFGYGVGSLGGWDVDVVEGDRNYNAVYFEDNTFLWQNTGAAAANAAIQNYYGARTVFRRNTIWNAVVDVHGDNTKHSGRWAEIYDNDWYASVNLANAIQLRGGSGVVFNNRMHNKPGAAGGRGIILWTETPGTGPMPCQVGRGKDITPGSHTNQQSSPLYLWNNTVVNEGGGTGGMGVGTQVAAPPLNGPAPISPRDYVNGTSKAGYTPAPYPHPLQGGAAPTPTPEPTATPTPTPLPTPTPAPTPMPGLSFQAEDGLISAPFVVSGGIVSQPSMTGVDQGGKAEYQIEIPDTGDYKVEMMVNTPSAAKDSFFINFDDAPVDPVAIWDVGVTNGMEQRTVSWRGGNPPDQAEFDPKLWNLRKGLHTLIVRGREGGAQFDAIDIILQTTPAPTPTPIPSPTPTPEPTPDPTPPLTHTHTISEIIGLQEALDSKSNTDHAHPIPAGTTGTH